MHKQVSKYISPSQINIIFTTYTNINLLKLKTVAKNLSIRCDGRDNAKKLCNFISIEVPYKAVVGYVDVKQQETYGKLKK